MKYKLKVSETAETEGGEPDYLLYGRTTPLYK